MRQSVCLYFKVHQAFNLKAYTLKEVDLNHCYIDEETDEVVINKLADECYLPANAIILSNIKKTSGKFSLSYSISGVILELLQKHRPDVIDSFKKLTATGSVEILGETYCNSLSFLYSKKEFERQIEKHSQLIHTIFGITPKVFRHTELIYNNSLAVQINNLGYKGILCEGIDRILKGRTPNQLYAPSTGEFALLLRNSQLSDDIAFRFDDKTWSEYPLTANKFAKWLHAHPNDSEVINLFMDYETFGVHKKENSGIFDFLGALPEAVLENENFIFSTPSDVISNYYPHDVFDVPSTISWENKTEACFIWSENARQNNVLKKIYSLQNFIDNSNNKQLIESWGRLQTADYIFDMAEHNENRKRLHPATSDHIYEYYKNIVTDLEISLIKEQLKKNKLDFIPLTHNVY